MKTSLLALLLSGLALAGPEPVDPAKAPLIEAPPEPPRFTLGAGFAPMLGLDVKFSGLGAWRNPLVPRPLGGGIDREYDDGFVRVDSSGNLDGLTWYWGYENPAQLDLAAGVLTQSIRRSHGTGSASESADFQPGFEIFGSYEMGKLSGSSVHWGLKGILHYAKVDVDNSDLVHSQVDLILDRFSLGQITIPSAPYSGTFSGPGPLISDRPTRSYATLPYGASVRGTRELDVDQISLSFGPYLGFRPLEHLDLTVEGGLTVGYADGDFTNRAVTILPSGASQTNYVRGSESDFLFGGFLGVSALYQLGEQWMIYGAARYQYLEDFTIDAGSASASLDYGGSFILSIGAGYRF